MGPESRKAACRAIFSDDATKSIRFARGADRIAD
jgi:hypothetical protein